MLELLKKVYALGYRSGTCNWGVTSRLFLFYEVMYRSESGYNTDRLGLAWLLLDFYDDLH